MSAARAMHRPDVTMNLHLPAHHFPPAITSSQHLLHFPLHPQSRHLHPPVGLHPQQEHEQALFRLMQHQHQHRHDLTVNQQVGCTTPVIVVYHTTDVYQPDTSLADGLL